MSKQFVPKATFVIIKDGKVRQFEPVNRKAWKLARHFGTNRLSPKMLKAVKQSGKFKVYAWEENRKLKAISL